MKASSESIVDSKFIAPKKCAFYLVIHRPAPAFKASYSSHSLGHNCKSLNEEHYREQRHRKYKQTVDNLKLMRE